MNETQESNSNVSIDTMPGDPREIIGRYVVVREGFGAGKVALVIRVTEGTAPDRKAVDLLFRPCDDDQSGNPHEDKTRRNYDIASLDLLTGMPEGFESDAEVVVPERVPGEVNVDGVPDWIVFGLKVGDAIVRKATGDVFLYGGLRDAAIREHTILRMRDWQVVGTELAVTEDALGTEYEPWTLAEGETRHVRALMVWALTRSRSSAEMATQFANAKREWNDWQERATRLAHDYANEHSLCGEFDKVMEEIGLEPRSRQWDVEVEVRVRVTVQVTATNEEDAANEAEDDSVLDDVVIDQIRNHGYDDKTVLDTTKVED